jgi:hypothetical protein
MHLHAAGARTLRQAEALEVGDKNLVLLVSVVAAVALRSG